ncbi:hypothetical protein 056SW001B_19 [Bacillus phage 056SW001B]|uniref:Uncharacterized protein n=3 Tax=Gettysburgvirus TaxID=3425034 RepID=A0A7T7ZAK5_9CAUD|nr:hypothetical protein 019DV002_18 [Bacillus phage 019DV002]QFG05246.1 hypothetical protein 019DV004_18 [Bacillus phage 019DV004]QFG05859.1 hypothetical protein 276BB001_20 [Bacillus phage 276BB001]QFG05940.1 hypothetical protein 280BB001_20 [Bacillus phage 280BB001]QFR56484.1 hypothetical protein 056SW001B_19 [Bacillus phage 056SW001B]QQO40364.1 hypothetical protein 268TH004_19 [Bacillus phage 268TH004]QZA70089.1 hypothetical protein 274BB002_20 [Bacillus phage 274BB002]
MIKIKQLAPNVITFSGKVGDIHELDETTAKYFIEKGYAEEVKEEKPKKAPAKKKTDK